MRNYSLLRAYENELVGGIDLFGRGIDLGAKSTDAKYYEFMDLSRVEHMDFVDFYHAGDGVIQMDLEKTFPLADRLYDFVLMFNVMEHIYRYDHLISESRRILKTGGTIHGIVPLIWHFHPDPQDYFRFTWQALERILQGAGFSSVRVQPVAYGPFKVAASHVGHVMKIRAARMLLYAMAMGMDRAFALASKGGENFAMAYYFSAVKVERVDV